MAWNPSPQVAVARDAARAMTKAGGRAVNRVVVLYTTDDGRLGCASYGVTKDLCIEARSLADSMYAAATRYAESHPL